MKNTLKPNTGNEGYKPKSSSAFIQVIAGLLVIAGIIVIFIAMTNSKTGIVTEALIIYGISAIVVAALLFIIAGLADDVHLLTYVVNNDNKKYQSFVLSHLRDIDTDLDTIKKGIATTSANTRSNNEES